MGSFREKFEAMAVAVAFAERGDWETSKWMLKAYRAARPAKPASARHDARPRAGVRL